MLSLSFSRSLRVLACCLLLFLGACKPQQPAPAASADAATPAALPAGAGPAKDEAWPAPDKV
ncbi:MAG TPA: hypothetical protein PK861_09210, partial [Thermomonas sp.]|nr:hypothetical protein [Thermomonas sp.]